MKLVEPTKQNLEFYRFFRNAILKEIHPELFVQEKDGKKIAEDLHGTIPWKVIDGKMANAKVHFLNYVDPSGQRATLDVYVSSAKPGPKECPYLEEYHFKSALNDPGHIEQVKITKQTNDGCQHLNLELNLPQFQDLYTATIFMMRQSVKKQ